VNQHLHWYHEKDPNFFVFLPNIIDIDRLTKSGSLSANLTFRPLLISSDWPYSKGEGTSVV